MMSGHAGTCPVPGKSRHCLAAVTMAATITGRDGKGALQETNGTGATVRFPSRNSVRRALQNETRRLLEQVMLPT